MGEVIEAGVLEGVASTTVKKLHKAGLVTLESIAVTPPREIAELAGMGIDTAIKLGYNMEMGPLALADQMGLDEVMLWMESLFHELGDQKYRPCPLLRKMVRAGHLGKKTRRGFFHYDESGRIIRKGVAE